MRNKRRLPERHQERRSVQKWTNYATEAVVPRKKTWTVHDLIDVRALTENQQKLSNAFEEGKHLVAFGSAGTGKSFLSLYLALNEILYPKSPQKIITIVRSAVATREQGFLKGTLEEKETVYEIPYRDLFCEIVGKISTYEDMKTAGIVQFCTTSFIRSLTWNNSIVIIDEGQSMTFHEINSVLTRLGENSRLIFIGDLAQNDLAGKKQEQSGMERFLRIAGKMEEFAMVRFTRDDIVRSDFVRNWIIMSEETP